MIEAGCSSAGDGTGHDVIRLGAACGRQVKCVVPDAILVDRGSAFASSQIGVISDDCGAGMTVVARAAVAKLDASRTPFCISAGRASAARDLLDDRRRAGHRAFTMRH